MPLYDFRCAECANKREVRATVAQAGDLELICTACGGPMRKTISRTVALITGAVGAASPPPRTPSAPAERGHGCSDGVVKLTRPNPFARTLLSTGRRMSRVDLPAQSRQEAS